MELVIGLSLWTLFLFALVFWGTRKKDRRSISGYALASRNLSTFQVAASLIASYIGGGTLIAFSGQITEFGYAFIFAPLGVVFAFVLMSVMVKFYRRKDGGGVSTTTIERLTSTYGNRIFWPSVIVVLLSLISFISIQLYGGALLISKVFDIPEVVSALALAIITAIYSRYGGSYGDVLTDIFQGILIFAVVIGGLFFVFDAFPITELARNVPDKELLNPFNQGIGLVIAMIVLPLFAIHTDPSIQFRLYMAKSDVAAKRATLLSAFLYAFFCVCLIFFVMGIYANTGLKGDSILIDFMNLQGSILMKIGLSLAIYSAVISTMDSQAIKASTIIVNDIFTRYNTKEMTDDEKGRNIKNMVFFMFIFAFLMVLFLLMAESAFLFLSALWVIGISSFGLMFIGLAWKRLGDIMKSHAYILKWDIIISSLLVVVAIFYLLLTKNDNPSTIILVLGTVIVFVKLFFYYIINLLANVKPQ